MDYYLIIRQALILLPSLVNVGLSSVSQNTEPLLDDVAGDGSYQSDPTDKEPWDNHCPNGQESTIGSYILPCPFVDNIFPPFPHAG